MSKIILVDGNNLLYRSYYATAYSGSLMKNSKGFPTNALYGFVNMILKIVDEEKPEYMMIAFDKGKTFRHEKYETYKGTRSETPSELISQFPLSRELCDALGITHLEIDNYEADDIIGTFAKKYENEEVLIISSDKDLLQLITDNVKVKLLKVHDYILMDKKEFQNTYGLEPIKMIDLKSLMGDSSDNIPGVKGIGEKTAIKLLQEYGSLDNLYNNIDNIKGSVKNKLIEDRENAYMSYDLATIYKDVPIETSLLSIKKKNIDTLKYMEILKELEFYSLLKKVDDSKVVSSDKEIKVIKDLNSFKLDKEYALYLEVFGYNYHDAKPLGVSIYCDKQNYFIPIETLENSSFFCDGLKKYTYDLKKVLVVFDRYNIKIDKNVRDLMIEAYLINRNVKNDIAYLANQYFVALPFYDSVFGTEITLHEVASDIYIKNACLKAEFILEYKDTLYEEMVRADMIKLYQEMELPLVFVLAKMESNGFKVDREYLDLMKDKIGNKLKELEESIYEISGEKFNIASPKQLGVILFEKLAIPYPKRIKDNNYSTSKEILDRLKGNYKIIDLIMDYRMYAKLYNGYIVGLIDEIKEDGKIHTIFNQTLTRTGRLSSERPNLQNIPARIEEGKLIRKAFIPGHGSIIISADYSQIELRVFAHMSNAKNMIKAFKEDVDIHTKTASEIYHVPIDEVTKDMRRSAKAVNFGIIYGISSFGLSEDLGIDVMEAKKFIDTYLETFPGIKDYMESIVKEAYLNGYVKTLFNRKRFIDELKNKNYLIRSTGERMAMNAPIQGTAADILKLAMIKIDEEMEKNNLNSKMLLQVHDELVFEVLENEVEIMSKLIRDIMENIYKMSVPLKVDIEYGKTWYEAK